MAKLFGTDGVRGRAGEFPLDHDTVARLGAALVRALRPSTPSRPLRFIVGRDTRESGEWIERELAHAAIVSGATVRSAGIVPTPAVAFLTGSLDFDAGLVISASHNPYEDNGIKVFSGAGVKYGGEFEERIEQIVADKSWSEPEGEAQAVPRAELSGSREHRPAASRTAASGTDRRRLRQRRDDGRRATALPRIGVRRHSTRR
jgi:phosphoglucosamine mutase